MAFPALKLEKPNQELKLTAFLIYLNTLFKYTKSNLLSLYANYSKSNINPRI